ncbi:MAG TPA: HAD family hydrolase, partial [Candidatus Saccharicenans sp.]|nr:HAD family hydrolase [Candidatus Saccharicenans sp.]
MNYKGVIFDLDGTLLDTIEDITSALNTVMLRHGFKQFSIEEAKKMVGDGMRELMVRAKPELTGQPELIDALVNEFRQEYARVWREHSRPYPSIPELLTELNEKGLKLAVLSNKAHPFTEIMVKELLPVPFQAVHGSQPGIPLKPDPAPARLVLQELNLRPDEVLYVGDTAVDMKTALAAGLIPVGVLWGFREARELLDNGARALLLKPADLLPLVFDEKRL